MRAGVEEDEEDEGTGDEVGGKGGEEEEGRGVGGVADGGIVVMAYAVVTNRVGR